MPYAGTRGYSTSAFRIPAGGGMKAAVTGGAHLDQAVATPQSSSIVTSPGESDMPPDPGEGVVEGVGTNLAVGNACGQRDSTKVVAPARADPVQRDITKVVAPVRWDAVATAAPGSCGEETTQVVTRPADVENRDPDELVPQGIAAKFDGRNQRSYESAEVFGGMGSPEYSDTQPEDIGYGLIRSGRGVWVVKNTPRSSGRPAQGGRPRSRHRRSARWTRSSTRRLQCWLSTSW